MQSINPDDLTALIIGTVLLILIIRHQRRKRAEERKRNRNLFFDRFSELTQHASKDVSLLELAERQLTDWQHLLAELETNKSPADQLRYCRQQISRFEKEVAWLRRQSLY